MDTAVTSGAGRPISAGVAVVETLIASHGGQVCVPANRTHIVAENLCDVEVGVGHGAGPGFVVHVAPLHLGEGVSSYLGQPNGPGVDCVGRGEVEFG